MGKLDEILMSYAETPSGRVLKGHVYHEIWKKRAAGVFRRHSRAKMTNLRSIIAWAENINQRNGFPSDNITEYAVRKMLDKVDRAKNHAPDDFITECKECFSSPLQQPTEATDDEAIKLQLLYDRRFEKTNC